MSRFKVGDVILNKWASERNPIRKGIYIGGGYLVNLKYGRFHKYTLVDLEEDTEHFVVIGNEPIKEMFGELLEKYKEV